MVGQRYYELLNLAHWWIGRLVSIGAIITIITGILYADYYSAYALALPVLTIVIGVGGIGAFVFGEFKFGQVNHVAEGNGSDSGEALRS